MPDPETGTVAQELGDLQGNSTQGNSTQGNSTQSQLMGVQSANFNPIHKPGVGTLTGANLQQGQLRGSISGTTYSGAALVGFRLQGVRGNYQPIELLIDGYQTDVPLQGQAGWNMISSDYPAEQSNADVHLYRVLYRTTSSNPWQPLCPSRFNSDGDPLYDSEMAVFTPGVWLIETGQYQTSLFSFSIGCWKGTIAKCLRWGYKPWKSMTPPGGPPRSLHDLHLACVRGAMADYCGDGDSHTVPGTRVDVYDRYGFIEKSDEGIPFPSFSEESSFDVGGAGCIERARWESIGSSCPLIYELIDPEYTGEPETGTRPKMRNIPQFSGGDLETCYSSRPNQLVFFDSSTYCPHSPYETGAAMNRDCNTCTAIVCGTKAHASCCDRIDTDGPSGPDTVGSWSSGCVSAANIHCGPQPNLPSWPF